jgi:putative transposase
VSTRVSPTERIRAEIDELFASERDLATVLEEVARLSVRLVMQSALEAEVTEFLGRERYQRHDHDTAHRGGHRNGWQPPATVKTTMGPVELQRPKLRSADEAICSRLFGAGDPHQRAGIAGDLRLGAGPVGPGYRGRPG